MPGRTNIRRRSSPWKASSATASGRGPTSDMEPPRTLNSCGNSSMDERRRNRPTGVIRGSSRILNNKPSASLLVASEASRSSASLYIERNFQQANSCPALPTRTCLNSAGPELVTRITMAVISKTGENTTRPTTLPTRSTARLTTRRPPVNCGSST